MSFYVYQDHGRAVLLGRRHLRASSPTRCPVEVRDIGVRSLLLTFGHGLIRSAVVCATKSQKARPDPNAALTPMLPFRLILVPPALQLCGQPELSLQPVFPWRGCGGCPYCFRPNSDSTSQVIRTSLVACGLLSSCHQDFANGLCRSFPHEVNPGREVANVVLPGHQLHHDASHSVEQLGPVSCSLYAVFQS